jgi:hypothetical protein
MGSLPSHGETITMTEEKVNLVALRQKIKKSEIDLFALKLQYAKLYKAPAGKIIIDPPSEYRCKTCFNNSCIFHPRMNKRYPSFVNYIHGITATQGCLSWLPEDKGDGV